MNIKKPVRVILSGSLVNQ